MQKATLYCSYSNHYYSVLHLKMNEITITCFSVASASSARTILRACPGCTRSSRVEVVNRTLGHDQPFIGSLPEDPTECLKNQ